MIKIPLPKNKKVRRLFICIIGIAFPILICLLYSKINFYLDELSAKNLVQNFVDNSKSDNEKGIRDCFIKEYQRSLDAYKKYNPGKPLFDWRIVKLNKIKIVSKKYGELALHSPDYSNIMNWDDAKVFYTEVLEKTTEENFMHKNGLNYLIFITVKQQGRWKIVSINHFSMGTIIKNNVGFGVGGEKKILKRDNKFINHILGHAKFDYRNMIIPEYDPDISIMYNMSYNELEKRIKTIRLKLEDGTSYNITKKANMISLIRDIDKVKSEMPLTKIEYGRGGYISSVCSITIKTKFSKVFNISKLGNTLIYYDPYYDIAKAIPNSMVKLLNLSSFQHFTEYEAIKSVIDHDMNFNEYPHIPGIKKAKINCGGKAPGITIPVMYVTESKKIADESFEITFIEKWNSNNLLSKKLCKKLAMHKWIYEVTPEKVQRVGESGVFPPNIN